ncbi:MAG: peptide deformylase [Parcubacteria group bacterium CG10_big_fil_rev_8_21_14_0_10_36_14]|nr:MAG: peptide deformylase [Parcubacteria group bacterium CG10_big_fil_rev_8_21_14_0_10_36_14]
MIVTYPNKLLRQKSTTVKTEEFSSPEIKKLIADMKYWIKKAGGVGLAAVQIGTLKRIILVEIDGNIGAYINPKITKRSLKKIAIEEGCLSVPGKNGYVKRSQKITVKTLNEQGDMIKLDLKNIPSIIFQHEIDHLNGVLFIDKLIKK